MLALPQSQYHDDDENELRLRQLGLHEEVLRQVVLNAHEAKSKATKLHPRSKPGYEFFSEGIYSLRLALSEQGWKTSWWRNVDRVMNPDGTFAIFLMRGNAATGLDKDVMPSSAKPKRSDTRRLVMCNGGWAPAEDQFSLFEDNEFFPDIAGEEPRVDVPHLCLLYNHTGNRILYELSLPVGLDARNFVCDWRNRILLNPIQLLPNAPVTPAGQTGEVSIAIRKKEG